MNKPPHRPPIPPLLALAFAILSVSTASIFIRYAQVYAASLVIAAYRLTLASLLLAPIALVRYRAELLALKRGELRLALISGLFLAIHFATWITSLEYTTVASSVVLVTTTPLWVAILSPFTIKEPLRFLVKIGMVMALIGGIIVGVSDSCDWGRGGLDCPVFSEFIRGKAFLGDLLALAGAFMGAGYILIGRRLRRDMSLVSYIFLVYGMGAGVLLVIVMAARYPLFSYPIPAYIWFVLVALVPQLLGHSTFNWALRYVSAAYVSISLLGEPVGSTILAYFLLQEIPTPLKIFGAILILTGIYVASRSERRL